MLRKQATATSMKPFEKAKTYLLVREYQKGTVSATIVAILAWTLRRTSVYSYLVLWKDPRCKGTQGSMVQ